MRHIMLGAASAALAFSVSPAAVLAQQSAPPAEADLCRELATFLERRGNAQPASQT